MSLKSNPPTDDGFVVIEGDALTLDAYIEGREARVNDVWFQLRFLGNAWIPIKSASSDVLGPAALFALRCPVRYPKPQPEAKEPTVVYEWTYENGRYRVVGDQIKRQFAISGWTELDLSIAAFASVFAIKQLLAERDSLKLQVQIQSTVAENAVTEALSFESERDKLAEALRQNVSDRDQLRAENEGRKDWADLLDGTNKRLMAELIDVTADRDRLQAELESEPTDPDFLRVVGPLRKERDEAVASCAAWKERSIYWSNHAADLASTLDLIQRDRDELRKSLAEADGTFARAELERVRGDRDRLKAELEKSESFPVGCRVRHKATDSTGCVRFAVVYDGVFGCFASDPASFTRIDNSARRMDVPQPRPGGDEVVR